VYKVSYSKKKVCKCCIFKSKIIATLTLMPKTASFLCYLGRKRGPVKVCSITGLNAEVIYVDSGKCKETCAVRHRTKEELSAW